MTFSSTKNRSLRYLWDQFVKSVRWIIESQFFITSSQWFCLMICLIVLPFLRYFQGQFWREFELCFSYNFWWNWREILSRAELTCGTAYSVQSQRIRKDKSRNKCRARNRNCDGNKSTAWKIRLWVKAAQSSVLIWLMDGDREINSVLGTRKSSCWASWCTATSRWKLHGFWKWVNVSVEQWGPREISTRCWWWSCKKSGFRLGCVTVFLLLR